MILNEASVAVVPGRAFGLPGSLRIAHARGDATRCVVGEATRAFGAAVKQDAVATRRRGGHSASRFVLRSADRP